jgi:hypothetical protein
MVQMLLLLLLLLLLMLLQHQVRRHHHQLHLRGMLRAHPLLVRDRAALHLHRLHLGLHHEPCPLHPNGLFVLKGSRLERRLTLLGALLLVGRALKLMRSQHQGRIRPPPVLHG